VEYEEKICLAYFTNEIFNLICERRKAMKSRKTLFFMIISFCVLGLLVVAISDAIAANAKLDLSNFSDMSDCDPSNPVEPEGDVIKIGFVASFSGPAAGAGNCYFSGAYWAVHDINKRGGILVDGKRKKIQLIKANHESKPAITKKVCERMVLQEKVDILMGTNGSNNMKIINQVADKYKVIAVDFIALSDELYNAKNFTKYSFMTCLSTNQVGRTAAYFLSQRKKEKKIYVLCQDYLFGHSMAEGFLKGMKEYYPEGEIVGVDYHKLFLTDFAPYLTKIKASGAEAIYTGDWSPDGANLVMQARQMGIDLPFIHLFLEDPIFMKELGVEASKGLMKVAQFAQTKEALNNPLYIKYLESWRTQSKKWGAPFDNAWFKWPIGANVGTTAQLTYWLLSVIERAGSTDPDKIIEVWEGDSYEMATGHVINMRPCDHKAYQDLYVIEYVPPAQQSYHWFDECSWDGPVHQVPAEKVMPLMDPDLERCK